MQIFILNLNKELDIQLQSINLEPHDIIQYSQQSFIIVTNALKQLKAFVLGYTFKDEMEEIIFFKKIKPAIRSKAIYYKKIIEIESLRPTGSYEIQENYLKKELKKLTLFFNEHKELYQYYRTQSTHFDDKYFSREKSALIQKMKSADIDDKFSTSHDYFVAKIIANDFLEIYLKQEIEKISRKLKKPNSDQLGELIKDHLQWTDSKASLIELIYALCATGSINNGKCEIREIALVFEEVFNIQLSETIYRTFVELKIRSNPTKFIDKLKNAFLQKTKEKF